MSPRPKLSHVRKPQILSAAIEAIYDRGFSDVRISDVAERAGTSSATVLYYFASKDELLEEALFAGEDRFYNELSGEITTIESGRERILRLFELSASTGPNATDDWVLWIEVWARALRHPKAKRTRQELDRRWRAAIADVIRYGQERGEFTQGDPDQLALMFGSLMDGLAVQVALGDPDVSPERMVELLGRVAATELGFEAATDETATAEEAGKVGVQ